MKKYCTCRLITFLDLFKIRIQQIMTYSTFFLRRKKCKVLYKAGTRGGKNMKRKSHDLLDI